MSIQGIMSSEKASNNPGLLDHREICCEDGTGSGSCLMVVALAALNLKILLAESLIARRELGRHRLQVS